MNLVAPKSKVDANSSGGVCAPNSALSSSHLIAICQNGTRYPATVTPARLSDLDFAADLVRDATGLAVSARLHLPRNAIVQKSDGSVVTAVDVALQIYILDALDRKYGTVATIAEEDQDSILGKPAAQAHVEFLLDQWGVDATPARRAWALSCGRRDGSTRDLARLWVLDPIDGTQGFVDGAHWCPCLALLAHGEVVFSANGHPTLARSRFEGGVALAAERGSGTFARSLQHEAPAQRMQISSEPFASSEVVRVVSPDPATANQNAMRRAVGESVSARVELIPAASQAKYGLIIMNEADVAYSRRGAGPGKYLWDHAGAILLAREAGAWVGDTDGSDIDLSQGRRLSANRAVICAARGLGPRIAAALAAGDVSEGFTQERGTTERTASTSSAHTSSRPPSATSL